MASPDDQRRQADLDWLYGSERPSIDRTQTMDASELAELERRRGGAAAGAQAARSSNEATPPAAAAPRVVHSESDLADAAPAPRMIAPTPGRPTPTPTDAKPMTAPPAAATPRPPRTPKAPRPARSGPSGRPRWGRWLLVALIAWIVWLLVVPMIALSRSPQIKEQPSGDRPAQQPGTLTLLVGSDKRSGLTAEQQAELGTGGNSIEGERTDTMMLLYRPASGKPVLVSLPRDTYAKIPGHGHNKLNAAYAFGGPQLLVETVEGMTGLRVDNYLEVGFDGFANVVDSLGGIRMCLDAPMVDAKSHTNLPQGCQTLKGTQALGYVRMRYADPQGDLGRVKRQRAMIAAIAKKAESPWTFINPVRYWSLNMAAGKGLTRGEDTGTTELPGIARAFLDVSGHSDQSLTVPISNPDYQVNGGSLVQWDEQKSSDMFASMARGDTSNLAQYAK